MGPHLRRNTIGVRRLRKAVMLRHSKHERKAFAHMLRVPQHDTSLFFIKINLSNTYIETPTTS